MHMKRKLRILLSLALAWTLIMTAAVPAYADETGAETIPGEASEPASGEPETTASSETGLVGTDPEQPSAPSEETVAETPEETESPAEPEPPETLSPEETSSSEETEIDPSESAESSDETEPEGAETETASETEESSEEEQTEPLSAEETETTETGEPDTSPIPESLPEPLREEESLLIGLDLLDTWAGFDNGLRGNARIPLVALRLDALLRQKAESLRALFGRDARISLPDRYDIADVLAVYAVLTGQTAHYPERLKFADTELLTTVYWTMTRISGSATEESGAQIAADRIAPADAAERLGFTEEQNAELEDLLKRSEDVRSQIDGSVFALLGEEELEEILETVSESVSIDRQAVLANGLGIAGKVGYFWGGKSQIYGWDDRWGDSRLVTAEGSSRHPAGTVDALGLDCSGFVSWDLVNVFGPESGELAFFNTGGLWTLGKGRDWTQAQPGDMVFYYNPGELGGRTNHVGLVLTAGADGPEKVLQCGSGGVKVVGASRFRYVRTPLLYGEDGT